MQKPLRRSATHARGGATTTSCGVAVAFVLGLGLIATGIQLTTHQAGAAPMDGAHFLRQARYVPSQREAAAEPRLDGARRSTAEPQQRAPHGANGITRVEGTLNDNPAFQAAMAGTAPTTTTNAAHSPAISKGACLVTKWSAVWLVHADKRTRSHISAPTVSCDLHASEVDDIEQYAKAHGGAGAYVLGEADSKLACEMPGCTPKVAAEGEAGGAGADALAPPANGWGAGVAAGWPERSALKFNEPASEGFARSPPPPGEPLLLVFGGASVNDMLRNWAIHARRLGMGYVVACMDQQLFDLAASKAIPAVMMKDKVGGGAGGDGAVTTRWKYYRMDPKAFMQMGILKVRFFMEFLRGGFDLLCSDLDVVWLRSPLPYLAGEAGTALLPLADVVVSTDVTHGGADNDRDWWGLFGELNTGIILLRSTFPALALCDEWIRRMQYEMVHKPPPSGGFLQWWSNDQTFFNEVVHRAQQIQQLGFGLKAPSAEQRRVAASLVRQAAEGSARPRLAAVDAALGAVEALYEHSSAATTPAQSQEHVRRLRELRNVQFKRLTCHGCASHQTTLAITTLPFLYFASGHTFFTQSLQERRGFLPVCVHTTFQFGDTAEFTWGKRSRLREKLLWDVDDDGYYRRQGAGTHPAEATYEGFLLLSGELLDGATRQDGGLRGPSGQPLARSEAAASVKVEGTPDFVAKTLERHVADVWNMPVRNPNRHLLIDAFQRRLVHNAMALGRALRRKVIMPRMYCWCDRFWNVMADCRLPGVSAEQLPLPFHCPFDHVYDLEKWVHSDAPFREYSFLNNSRIPDADKRDRVRLGVRGASDGSGGEGLSAAGERAVVLLNPGASYADAAKELRGAGHNGAYVVDISARSLELLCETLGDGAKNKEFNDIMHTVLGVAEQVRYCDEAENPTYGKGPHAYDEWLNPINCTWGFHRPPKLPEAEPPMCGTDARSILDARWAETTRSWSNPGWHRKRREAWSTRDRPAYLHHNTRL